MKQLFKKPYVLFPSIYLLALLIAYIGTLTPLDSCSGGVFVICFGLFSGLFVLLLILPSGLLWNLVGYTVTNTTDREIIQLIIVNTAIVFLLGLAFEVVKRLIKKFQGL